MTDREVLDDLLDQYEDLPPSERPSAVDDFCRRLPHLASKLRHELKLLARVDEKIEESSGGMPSERDIVIPKEVVAGRYRATSVVGQGGLGQVFAAEDLELGREVALKRIMPGRSAIVDNQARFRREAKITGRLEHPGVVPVYGLGADGKGQPYYAMRLIRGGTLDAAIEKFHRELPVGDEPGAIHASRQALIRRFLAMTQTVAYAHSKGILHRDLKPQNVIVGDFGETIVIDWGLAKSMGETESDDDELIPSVAESTNLGVTPTMHGQRKGSPAYMSPEQAAGNTHQLSEAADVYSLGATLYKVLTGRPPFEGSPDVFDRIARGRFPRPRTIRRDIPAALEAICLKAMATNSRNRYASANDLAADIERWLADEPVHAWREPIGVRTRRFMKRHRTLATATAAAVVALMLVSTAAGIVLQGKNLALQHSNDQLAASGRALQQSNDELLQSNNNLASANELMRREFDESNRGLRGVVENMMASGRVGDRAGAPILRADSLRVYRTYLNGFIERNEHRPEALFETAAACLHRGEVEYMLNEVPAAVQSYEKAGGLFKQLLDKKPADREARFGLAGSIAQRGVMLTLLGRFDEAKPLLETARKDLEELAQDPAPIRLARMTSSYDVEGFPDSPALRLAQVTYSLVGEYPGIDAAAKPTVLRRTASSRISKQHLEWTRSALKALTNGRDLTLEAPVMVQFWWLNLEILVATESGDQPAQRRRLNAVIERTKQLQQLYPLFFELNVLAIGAEVKLAEVYEAEGNKRLAQSYLYASRNSARQLESNLQKNDPMRMLSDALVAQIEVNEKLVMLLLPGEFDQIGSYGAFQECMRAIDRFAAMKRHAPTDTVKGILACIRIGWAAIQAGGRKAWAEEAYQKARNLCETQLRENPGEEAFEIMQLTTAVAEAGMKAALSKPFGDMLDRAERLLEKLVKDSPNDPFLIVQRASIFSVRGTDAAMRQNDSPRGIALMEQALAVLKTAESLPETGEEIAIMHYIQELQLVAILGRYAEILLDEKPPKNTQAKTLIDRARKLVQDRKERKPPPVSDPDLESTLKSFQVRLDAFLVELDKLEKRVKP